MPNPRQTAPSHRAIAAYWIGRALPGTDRHSRILDVGEPCCFACGWWHEACPDGCVHGLQKAHALPHANGGSDTDPANFALLCKQCHRDAPDTDDAEWFWRWIAECPVNRCPMQTGLQHSLEADRLMRSLAKPEELAAMASTSGDEWLAAAHQAMERVRPVTHDGRFSPSTVARLAVESARILLERPA
jgi:hypothetical protein